VAGEGEGEGEGGRKFRGRRGKRDSELMSAVRERASAGRSKKRSGSYDGGTEGGREKRGAILRVTSSTYFRVNDNYYPADVADLFWRRCPDDNDDDDDHVISSDSPFPCR